MVGNRRCPASLRLESRRPRLGGELLSDQDVAQLEAPGKYESVRAKPHFLEGVVRSNWVPTK